MKRRYFLSRFGLGLMASSLPMAIAACQGSRGSDYPSRATLFPPEKPEGPPPRADGFVVIGPVAELDTYGFIGKAGFAIIRDPHDASEITAVTSMCPHQGCHVIWDTDTGFVCPCHGARFGFDGTVREGPANHPLSPVNVKVENSIILVKGP